MIHCRRLVDLLLCARGCSSGTCRLVDRSLLLCAGVLLFLAGCAFLGATRPVAPFSIPLSESPEEFRWAPFKWPHGTVLSYQLQGFVELTVKGQKSTEGLAQAGSFEARGQTAKGFTRVEYQLAGKPQGTLFFDSGGQLLDIEAVTSEAADELKLLLGWNTLPSVRALFSEVLRINTPREIDLSSAEVFSGARWANRFDAAFFQRREVADALRGEDDETLECSFRSRLGLGDGGEGFHASGRYDSQFRILELHGLTRAR